MKRIITHCFSARSRSLCCRPAALVVAWLVLGSISLVLSGCEEQGTHSAEQQTTIVRVQQPVTKSVTDYEYFTGRTEAPYSLDVRAKVNGYLVRWNFDAKSEKPPTKDFNFVVGQEVKRDQVLFKIDPRPYQATYDQAIAQVNLAKAQLGTSQGRLRPSIGSCKNTRRYQPARCRQVFGSPGESGSRSRGAAGQFRIGTIEFAIHRRENRHRRHCRAQFAFGRQSGRSQYAADDRGIGRSDVRLLRRR